MFCSYHKSASVQLMFIILPLLINWIVLEFVQQKYKINIHSFAEMCLGMNSFRMTNEKNNEIPAELSMLILSVHPLLVRSFTSFSEEALISFQITFSIVLTKAWRLSWLYFAFWIIIIKIFQLNIMKFKCFLSRDMNKHTCTHSILKSDLDCRIHAKAFYHIPWFYKQKMCKNISLHN